MRMRLLGLPIIDSLADLAAETRLSGKLISRLVHQTGLFYRRFEISKRSGAKREIHAPDRRLKALQAWILRSTLANASLETAATAFRRGVGLRANALPHADNSHVLCLDIADFFPSIPAAKVFSIFRALGYSDKVCWYFTRLCTLKNALPQGAVTSPCLSNIVCMQMDRRISGYAARHGINYTRYADDITLSGTNPGGLLAGLSVVAHIIRDEGFKINDAKTRIMGPSRRRVVTGLVVGQGRIGIGRRSERLLRAKLHQMVLKFSLDGHAPRELAALRGYIAFMHGVDRASANRMRAYLEGLYSKHGRVE